MSRGNNYAALFANGMNTGVDNSRSYLAMAMRQRELDRQYADDERRRSANASVFRSMMDTSFQASPYGKPGERLGALAPETLADASPGVASAAMQRMADAREAAQIDAYALGNGLAFDPNTPMEMKRAAVQKHQQMQLAMPQAQQAMAQIQQWHQRGAFLDPTTGDDGGQQLQMILAELQADPTKAAQAIEAARKIAGDRLDMQAKVTANQARMPQVEERLRTVSGLMDADVIALMGQFEMGLIDEKGMMDEAFARAKARNDLRPEDAELLGKINGMAVALSQAGVPLEQARSWALRKVAGPEPEQPMSPEQAGAFRSMLTPDAQRRFDALAASGQPMTPSTLFQLTAPEKPEKPNTSETAPQRRLAQLALKEADELDAAIDEAVKEQPDASIVTFRGARIPLGYARRRADELRQAATTEDARASGSGDDIAAKFPRQPDETEDQYVARVMAAIAGNK